MVSSASERIISILYLHWIANQASVLVLVPCWSPCNVKRETSGLCIEVLLRHGVFDLFVLEEVHAGGLGECHSHSVS